MGEAKESATGEVRRFSGRQESAGQYGLGMVLLMFAWPAAWYTLIIYVARPLMVPAAGSTPTWFMLLVMVLGPGAELAAGLLMLRHEGGSLSYAWLQQRLRLHWPRGLRAWAIVLAVLVGAFALSMALTPLNRALAEVPGFVPPAWWPNASNPTVEVAIASDVFPDVRLAGNVGFVLLYLLIGLINVVGEEVYYRGFLLPRMRGVFGRFDWVANGLLFTLKHVYQRWLYPEILAGALAFAFAAGPMGSLPVAMVYHWVGNFLIQMVFIVKAAAGL